MYDFVYYVFYNRNIKKGQTFARYTGSLIAAFVIYLHLAFVFACLRLISKKFDSFHWPFLFKSYKFLIVIFLFALVSLIYIYFDKGRIEKLLLKYGKDEPYKESIKNQWIINLIIGAPLVLGAIVLSISKK